MTEKITEGYRVGTRVVLPEGKGAKARVRLMGWEPGTKVIEGSSGDYPVDAIRRDFASAFPKGTRMRANHDGICEMGGDIRRIIAKTTSAPEEESDGMYADAYISEEWTKWSSEFADVVGLSISAGVELERVAATDEDGEPILDSEGQPVMVNKKSERGATIVKRFLSMNESPYNSVDIVEAPGADGAVVALALESARNHLPEVSMREAATFVKGTIKPVTEQAKDSEATPSRNNKEEEMTDEEAKALALEAGKTAATQVLEALKPTESSDQPTFGDITESVIEAGLTKAGRKGVYERVARGEAADEAIAAEKQRDADVLAERGVTPAGDTEAPVTAGFGYTVGEGAGFDSKPQSKVNEEFDALTEELI